MARPRIPQRPRVPPPKTTNVATPTVEQMLALVAPFNDGRLTEAMDDCTAFIKRFPQHFFGYKLLGAIHERMRHYDLAREPMERAAQLAPNDAENLSNLAKVYKDLGRLDDALTTYQRALALRPEDTDIIGKYLFLLNYFDAAPPEKMLEFARRYGTLLSDKVAAQRFTAWHSRSFEQPLRVGLVSGDLLMHPVGFFLENVLANLDPARIRVTAYPTQNLNDTTTEQLKRHCADWRPIAHLNDTAAAQAIHDDCIDVLIDLSGLSAFHRLGVFAHKPAPVQATWLGYFATTGLPEMDFIIADASSIPPENGCCFSERVVRLPHTRLCYGGSHLIDAPPVAPLPALINGYLTFGCFQNLSKITDEVLQTWARVLHAVPNAHLRVQNKQLSADSTRAQFSQRCAAHGIPTERLQLCISQGFDRYLRAHSEVDVLLDTFPFPGGTTTCEALWMGVPTLTLCGHTMIARQGASLLSAAELGAWIVDSSDAYVAAAANWSQRVDELARLRHGLRQSVAASPLFDARSFAHDFTELLHRICATSSTD